MATITGTNDNDSVNTPSNDADFFDMLAGNDTVEAGGGSDTLDGGTGSDRLFGQGGDDYLFAGASGVGDNDSLDGGGGQDTVDYSQSSGGIAVTLSGSGGATINPPGDANVDTLVAIENIVGSNLNDTIIGNAGDNYLAGGLGADILGGGRSQTGDDAVQGAGVDTLLGGGGNDTLFGGTGNDILDGGADDDILHGMRDSDSLTGGTGNDTLYGGFANDTLAGDGGDDRGYGGDGNDQVAGAAGNDELYGGAGNDVVDGGSESDTIEGGAGNDTLTGGAGFDYLSFAATTGNVTVNLNATTVSGVFTGTDTISTFEAVLGGHGNDSITGTGGDNVLVGGAGNDTVSAGGGADTVEGGLGNDNLDGGGGVDVLSYRGATAGVNVTLNGTGTGEGSDTTTGFENLTGSFHDDTLTGDGQGNLIEAGGGNDQVDGGLGADTIDGETGNDTLAGGGGDDLIFGGAGTVSSTVAGNVAQDFNWSTSGGDTLPGGGISQDTGVMTVNVSYAGGPHASTFTPTSTAPIYVAPTETFSSVSGAFISRESPDSSGNNLGQDDPTVVRVDFANPDAGFSSEVENVRFRISDIDRNASGHRDRVVVYAYDAEGRRVPVEFIEESSALETGGDTVQATAGAGGSNDSLVGGSVLVRVAGPVSRIEIQYDNIQDSSQHIRVSDIQFQAVPIGEDDSIDGGAGNDTLFGGIGNDTLLGGTDNDVLFGGAGNDSLDGGDGNDTITGGTGNDTVSGGEFNDRFVFVPGDVNTVPGGDVDTVSPYEQVFGGGGGVGAPNDFDILDLSAFPLSQVEVVRLGAPGTDEFENGFVRILDADGVEIGRIDFQNIELVIPCFTPGTMILTDRGPVAVEALVPGDLVVTSDHGLQPLRWVGRRALSRLDLVANPDLQPVRIAAGAFAGQGPERTMLVSAQHRVLVTGARAELLFGEDEVLVPAKHLVGHMDATRALPEDGVTYIHILFDRHEVVQSDGLWTESFQPAERTLNAMEEAVRAEILALFPELATDASYEGARLSLKAHEARVLFAT